MNRHWIARARAAMVCLLIISSISVTLSVPLARPSAAYPGPTQPTDWPGYGSQWWDHWWTEVFVTYDVGSCAGTVCHQFFQDELYTFVSI